MRDEHSQKIEELYVLGIAQFQAADWQAAIETLSLVRSQSNAHPEIDELIAEAKLKLDLTRADASVGRIVPPKYTRILRPRFLTALPVLLIFGALLIAFRPSFAPPQIVAAPTVVRALPTPAPTNTPTPTETPLPTSTPVPTATPSAAALTVRFGSGQEQNRKLDDVAIILDASGSMGALISDRKRIDIAHEALTQLIERLPDEMQVSLWGYGHRRRGDCSDIEQVVPFSKLDRAALSASVNAINPAQLGQTPIGGALQQVAESLKGRPGDLRVVLVSDGGETCRTDPVQIARDIRAQNPHVTIDVIGFSVDGQISNILSDIAAAGGGRYFDASGAQQLSDALQQSVLLSYRVIDVAGVEVYQGLIGTSAELPLGRYSVELLGTETLPVGEVTVDGVNPAVVNLRIENDKVVRADAP